MSGISPKLPLQKSPADGYYGLTKSHIEAIRQNLKHLILTVPGERIMIPDFGVGLKRLLFEQKNQDLYSDISFRIKKQVNRYMPFVEIEDVEFVDSEARWTLSSGEIEEHTEKFLSQNATGSNMIKIRIMFYIPTISSRAVLSFRV